jgi:hypothetical protein
MTDCEVGKWSQRPGLNWRPLLYESIALPLSYAGLHRNHFASRAENRQGGTLENRRHAGAK